MISAICDLRYFAPHNGERFMSTQLKRRYTLEEYFDIELSSDERYEYWDGEIFCMSGVSSVHARIEINFITTLANKLKGRGCFVFPANMRLKVPSMPPYRYGDLSAVCGKPNYEVIGGVEALTNPQLIVEVLSSSTEGYDRGEKFSHYKSIPSFTEYILVEQRHAHVTQYVKQANGLWLQSEAKDIKETLRLSSLNCAVALEDLYEGVEFPAHGSLNLDRRLEFE